MVRQARPQDTQGQGASSAQAQLSPRACPPAIAMEGGVPDRGHRGLATQVFRKSYGKARPHTEGGFDGSLQRVDEGSPIPIPFPPQQQQQRTPEALREPAA